MRRVAPLLFVLVLSACAPSTVAVDLEPIPTTTTEVASTTTVVAVDVGWDAVAFDLHGVIRLEGTARPGIASAPDVFDDGVLVGEGRRTIWTEDGIPESVAQILGADCARIGPLLNRWADALYRLDVPEGEKAQADAYLGVGMERVADLGCDYEPDLEGRATPFP
ncbi:MAG: hypothetical protein HKN46_10505 [Acidimicrobiia bacterium]|nr:hypothetical protein [Acidimicrobiia bacterium]